MNKKKVLLVLGASSALGTEYLKRIWKNYDVVVAHYYKNIEELSRLQQISDGNIKLFYGDFQDRASTEQFIEKLYQSEIIPSHIIHFPASKLKQARFGKLDWELFEREIQISFRSIVMILQKFIPSMAKNKSGKIILMLSSVTENIPPKYMSYYVSVKYAMLGLMRALAQEYAEKGILINAISPEMIETKFLDDIPEMIIEQYAQSSPLKRNLTIDEIIPSLDFLLSDENTCITGQNLVITGGR